MDLFIIRHAQAGHYGSPQWKDDSKRPLTNDGERRFKQVVALLVERGFTPGVVATSPLVRCLQTARIVGELVPNDSKVVELDELCPGSDLQALMDWTAAQPRELRQVAWVGHAPDVGRMAAELIGNGGGDVRFAKGAVAAIRFHGTPEIGHGELRWLVTAKMLGC
ncbi:MAG: histidine phosphatase family protein [Pirellulales bacterium]|nr:histidine phosphatase family protein [Pirellulales bacterium]